MGSGYIDPSFLMSVLVRDEWSASRPGRFIPGVRIPGTYLIRGVVGPRVGLDDVEKRKSLTGLELPPLRRPARSESLYWLRYPGSHVYFKINRQVCHRLLLLSINLKPSGSTGTTCFNILKLCILPTQYIYVFHMVLSIKSDYPLKQHHPFYLSSGDVMRLLWGTE
jgi:hypothetical protein